MNISKRNHLISQKKFLKKMCYMSLCHLNRLGQRQKVKNNETSLLYTDVCLKTRKSRNEKSIFSSGNANIWNEYYLLK